MYLEGDKVIIKKWDDNLKRYLITQGRVRWDDADIVGEDETTFLGGTRRVDVYYYDPDVTDLLTATLLPVEVMPFDEPQYLRLKEIEASWLNKLNVAQEAEAELHRSFNLSWKAFA